MLHINNIIRRRGRQAIIIIFQLGAIGCVFPSQNLFLQWWANHALYIALGYLLLGLIFLLVNWPRLMFVCMACSAVICFSHHEKNNLIHPKQSPKIEKTEQNFAPIPLQDELKKDTQ